MLIVIGPLYVCTSSVITPLPLDLVPRRLLVLLPNSSLTTLGQRKVRIELLQELPFGMFKAKGVSSMLASSTQRTAIWRSNVGGTVNYVTKIISAELDVIDPAFDSPPRSPSVASRIRDCYSIPFLFT